MENLADRTLQELKADAQALNEAAGKNPTKWMR